VPVDVILIGLQVEVYQVHLVIVITGQSVVLADLDKVVQE
jgi:hypothetical protein